MEKKRVQLCRSGGYKLTLYRQLGYTTSRLSAEVTLQRGITRDCSLGTIRTTCLDPYPLYRITNSRVYDFNLTNPTLNQLVNTLSQRSRHFIRIIVMDVYLTTLILYSIIQISGIFFRLYTLRDVNDMEQIVSDVEDRL